jgi:ribonuclease VapC
MTSPYVFDSHALLVFFQNEEGAENVATILKKAMKQKLDRYISVINLGEIIYETKKNFGDNKKLEVLAHIHQLGFKVLPVPETLIFKAAEIKAGDPDFKKVAHLVNIDWIR